MALVEPTVWRRRAAVEHQTRRVLWPGLPAGHGAPAGVQRLGPADSADLGPVRGRATAGPRHVRAGRRGQRRGPRDPAVPARG